MQALNDYLQAYIDTSGLFGALHCAVERHCCEVRGMDRLLRRAGADRVLRARAEDVAVPEPMDAIVS
jgi:hypothetical protein